MSDQQLDSVRTYLTVAFVFCIISLIPWALFLATTSLIPIFDLIFAHNSLGAFGAAFAPAVGAIVAGGVVWLLFWGSFLTLDLLVLMRVNRMRRATESGDAKALQNLDSIGWAIAALIFSGIVPGVMLLVATGPIRSLRSGPAAGFSADDLAALTKLKSLLDAGVLSRPEFEARKARILGGEPPAPAEPDELRQLKALYEGGALTQEEYESQRVKILANI